MILFCGIGLNSNEGFFGLLLDDPSETSYQTLVNGIQMYLVAEDMLLDYAADYSVMLKRALEDWKKSTFSLVDVSLYVKDVYRARYPDRSTSGRTVNSCWKELNSDMSDDDAQLLRFKHVFIDNEDFTGLRYLYDLTEEEAQALGGAEYIRYLCLKYLVEIYTIFCPVDLMILHDGVVVAKIENDDITLDCNEIFLDIYKEADDEYAYKHLILPEGYELEISGFSSGTMSFEKAIIENGGVTTISTITDIPVQNGSAYTEVIEDGVTVALEYDQENDVITDQTLTAEVTNVVTVGDLNSDGEINASDAAMILVVAAAVGSGSDSGLTTEQEIAADLNSDGGFNAVDAAIVLQYAAAVGSGYTGTLDDFLAV